MLVPMAKVEIGGLRADLEPALAAVHRLGVLELLPLAPPLPLETPTIRQSGPERARLTELESAIDRAGTLLALLSPAPLPARDTRVWPATDALLAEATGLIGTLEPEAQRLVARRAALQAEREGLARYAEIMRRLLPVAQRLVELEGFETMALIIQPAYRAVVATLRAELATLTRRQCELVAAEAEDGSVAVLLVFSRRFAPEVHTLLQDQPLTEQRLPEAYRGRPFRESLSELDRRRSAIPRELSEVSRALDELLAPRGPQLATYRASLLDRLDELRATDLCLESDHTFIFGGWVPERALPALQAALDDEFGGRVAVERRPVGHADFAETPVLIENPRLVRPFEVLMRLLPAPRYGTVDPTPFVAFFFPFFFGLILGDIGYGLLLLGLAIWVQRRRIGPAWLQAGARVLRLCAFAAIAFGLAFGEFFGDLGHAFGLRPLVLERTEAIQPMLLFSVALGAAQVALGLVLGVVNGLLERQGKEALSRAATLVGLVAVFGLVSAAAGLLPRGLLTPGVALLAVAIALLVYSIGLVGPLEIFGALGNIVSYTRLVAVGLASVILAQVANQLAGRTGNIVLGIIVGALFHGLNLALGLFSPSIHSLRLQYVEFFGRFFQPGGRPFAPFRSRFAALAEEAAAP
jgi:V/A-type H+-transporting ATPase subunit I